MTRTSSVCEKNLCSMAALEYLSLGVLGGILLGSVVIFLAGTGAFFPKAFGRQWSHVLFQLRCKLLSSKGIPPAGDNVRVCSEVRFRVFQLSLL